MLEFLFKRETGNICEDLNPFYSALREMYSFDSIQEDRKEYLKSQMEKFGYLPYPHIKALEELSDAEAEEWQGFLENEVEAEAEMLERFLAGEI